MYSVEQQKKVIDLVDAISFYSHHVTIFDVENARDTLQEKCDDLMKYIDSIEEAKD